MSGRLTLAIIACLLATTLCGCKKEQTNSVNTSKMQDAKAITSATPQVSALPLEAPPFLSTPLDIQLNETINEALPFWKKYAQNRPLLVILAPSPNLEPIPEETRKEAQALLRDADDATLTARSGVVDPDPVLLPSMSVGAALDADWFSGVVWIFPSASQQESFDPVVFRQQIVEAGFTSADEAQSLIFSEGAFQGKVRGKQFFAAPLHSLPELDQPLLLHIDCAYFKRLYKGEIKTPLYPLLFETLAAIKSKGWRVAAATISNSNLDANLPLQTRFIGEEIADILTDPEMLDRPFPDSWKARANALYLENFMQKEEMRDIYRQLEKADPADPSIKYALYQLSRQFNKGDEALEYLRQAVQIDPIYALEYLSLSDIALEKKRPDKAVKMIKLARAARPNDPFILMRLARTLVIAGDRTDATSIANELRAINWSKTFYTEQAETSSQLAKMLSGS